MVNLKGKFAVCMGATSGIGRAVAVRMAELQANVTVFGRNPQLGAEVLTALQKANPEGEHSFIMVNASLIKSIESACDNYLAANPEKPLHYVVMSQGVATIAGRTETTEGIDNKMALHYYGRMMMLRQLTDRLKLTAVQPDNHDVRVLNIFSGGTHQSYTDLEDLDLKKNYTLQNAANACGFYSDLTLDQLSRDDSYLHNIPMNNTEGKKRGISYIHAAPGFVKTTWGKDMPFYLSLPIKFAQIFATSPEQCGDKLIINGILSPERQGQGFHIMKYDGKEGSVTQGHTAEMRDKVWEHTNAILDRALNNTD